MSEFPKNDTPSENNEVKQFDYEKHLAEVRDNMGVKTKVIEVKEPDGSISKREEYRDEYDNPVDSHGRKIYDNTTVRIGL